MGKKGTNKMKILSYMFFVIFLSCSGLEKKQGNTKKLCLSNETEESAAVKWVKKKSSVSKCKYLENVDVEYCDGELPLRTLYHLQVLKAKVADLKGNVLFLQADPKGTSIVSTISGAAYQCPVPKK